MGAHGCEVTGYPDGPWLVRGEFAVVDRSGAEVPVRRRTVAVCRCGRTRLAPFCDGTHTAAGFSAPRVPRAPAPAGVVPRETTRRAA